MFLFQDGTVSSLFGSLIKKLGNVVSLVASTVRMEKQTV